jgi:hypothetical protein
MKATGNQRSGMRHATDFAWQEVKKYKDKDPDVEIMNSGLAMSIVCLVAAADKKPLSECDWELPEREFRGQLGYL